MRKSDLFKLIQDFKALSGEEAPIIVGSQALHAVTDTLPEVARRSVECDFLLSSGNFHMRATIDEEMGVLSNYQVVNGFFADTLGLATVVLPDGWDKRLQPFVDDENVLIALCLDPYDLAVSKLIAGRDKDIEFIEALLASELLSIDKLLEQVKLVESMPLVAAQL